MRIPISFAVLVAIAAATACEREERRLNEPSPPAPAQFVAQVPLQPGPTVVTDTAEDRSTTTRSGRLRGKRYSAR